MPRWAPPPGPNSSLSPRPRPCVLLDDLPPSARRTCSSTTKPPLPPSAQDHGLFARHNKFGTFQVKIEQKTETRTKTQKTKTTMTQNDKMPTAGQRAVHFRTLAIIGVAAACGLSVPASGPR